MRSLTFVVLLFAAFSVVAASQAQQAPTTSVPNLINYSGVLKNASGRPITSLTGVTFVLYKDEQGGAPLWLETQNVTPDKAGHYTAQLGAASANGLPHDLFQTGEARWLAVQVAGEAEQPRVLLVAVPYAMKAADAETVGGLPPSAFVLAAPPSNGGAATSATSGGATNPASASPPPTSTVTTTGGTAGTFPVFTTTTNEQNSILTQSGTTTINVQGRLNLPATGTATAIGGKNSRAETFVASAFNGGTVAAVTQTFQWQAEPAGNDTTSPSATLNLLFGSGASTPAETGLKVSNKGLFTFAAGQKFPGTGTVARVDSGAGLSGGPITTSGTLSLASGGVTNAMLKNPSLTVTANSPLSGGGSVSLGGTTSLGLKSCNANQVLQFIRGAWTCANLASGGTITGVTAGTDLSGGGTSGTVTLSLDTTKVPRLVAANSFSAAQSITNSASADALTITNSGAGAGANISTVNGTGVFVSVGNGNTGVFSSGGLGVEGFSTSGTGVYGSSSGSVGNTAGVYGTSGAASGVGTGGRAGVWGDSTSNVAVYGSSKNQTGVLGQSANATGVEGYNNAAGYGMIGHAQGGGNYGVGVLGESFGTGLFPNGNGSDGVDGFAHSANGSGVAGLNDSSGPGVYGYSASGAAGVFDGNVTVAGKVLANGGGGQSTYGSGAFITKSVTILGDVTIGGGLVVEGNKYGFFIDHPLDPAHKYLAHTVIESPELKTMYDGLAILDSKGEAWVLLPDWFDALNRDCRYQLTSIGEPGPNLYIAQEVSGNRFKIAGGKPGGKVSWQVTGDRHDAYVQKHPFQAEREKTAAEQGYYVNPDAYGQPEEKGIEWARHPELMPRAKEGVVKPARASPEKAGVGPIR